MKQRCSSRVERIWSDRGLNGPGLEMLWKCLEEKTPATTGQDLSSHSSTFSSRGVVIVLPDGTPSEERKAVAKIAASSGKFTHIFQASTAGVVAFAHSIDTALVVDMGARGTRCSAVVDGCGLQSAATFTGRGGRSIVRAFRVSQLRRATLHTSRCSPLTECFAGQWLSFGQ